MKKILSVLLACCLLLCSVAFAEETASLPEVVVQLDDDFVLSTEEVVDGQGFMRMYEATDGSFAYVMLMNVEIAADDMVSGLIASATSTETLVLQEGGIQERKLYISDTDNSAADVCILWKDGYTVMVMLMTYNTSYESLNMQAMVDGWLESLTFDGEQLVNSAADAKAASAEKIAEIAASATPVPEETDGDEEIAIPVVEINFGGEGVLTNSSVTDNVQMQLYTVGEQNVFVMIYLGEYLCDGVWQSFTYELPESQLIAENENGIRQRKSYDYAAYGQTGDVTVVWYNGCTVAVVVSVGNEQYENGMQDTITEWINSMTIDGNAVVTQ